MALHENTGGIRPALDEHSGNCGAGGSTVAALHELVGAIRDNLFLDQATVDELLDMQPSNEHAKALLVALGVHELLPVHETVEAMHERGLGAF